jgi:flagella basal body P-ring formation protein FlgA
VLATLDEPTEISQGDKVRVQVVDGSAILSLDAVAQSSGKKGESILVHNPSTGKNFRAIVDAKGKVTVRSSPGA